VEVEVAEVAAAEAEEEAVASRILEEVVEVVSKTSARRDYKPSRMVTLSWFKSWDS
jgi:hypothetical protein